MGLGETVKLFILLVAADMTEILMLLLTFSFVVNAKEKRDLQRCDRMGENE